MGEACSKSRLTRQRRAFVVEAQTKCEAGGAVYTSSARCKSAGLGNRLRGRLYSRLICNDMDDSVRCENATSKTDFCGHLSEWLVSLSYYSNNSSEGNRPSPSAIKFNEVNVTQNYPASLEINNSMAVAMLIGL